MKSVYEFVEKKEYGPVKIEYEKIIRCVQKELQNILTFEYELIGSGENKLITRRIKGNGGFDFDYNLCLEDIDDNRLSLEPKAIREKIFSVFQKVIKSTGSNKYQLGNSTRVITLKYIDKENSKIIHSCDFGIIWFESENDSTREIIVMDKQEDGSARYIRNIIRQSKNYKELAEKIIENDLWDDLRELYLEKKNKYEKLNKSSFSIYLETVNEIYFNNFD